MTLTYKEKATQAINIAEKLSELEYIEEKIQVTDRINRRTKEGRELTNELLILINQKALQLIREGEQPF